MSPARGVCRRIETALVLVILIATTASAAPQILPANITVGANLQTSANISLSEPAPPEGMILTLTSSDPTRLLFSRRPDAAGSESIAVTVGPGRLRSQEFWAQAPGEAGRVPYAVSSPGTPPESGAVIVAPSGVIVVGPLRGPSFRTTRGALPSRIQVQSVVLDSSSNVVEEQVIAFGLTVEVNLTSSNGLVGKLANSTVTIPGGASTAMTAFEPAADGETTLTVSVPRGFSRPVQFASVTAVVSIPGIGLSDQLVIGKDLQLRGVAGLGEAAPAGGVTLTVTSDDPTQLLLSTTATDVGSESIQISFPAGTTTASYYLQALNGSGKVTYRASAPGYRDRSGTVTLTPSGILFTPAHLGPPDEAEVKRKETRTAPRQFVASVSKGGTEALAVWMAQLDPVTRRGADITVQPLRAGAEVTVILENANPAVGTVAASVTIAGGSEHAVTHFTPLSPGSTVLSTVTPAGFTTASNATSITAVVQP
jgi:hypothetical protein